jgi:hypothetical protein
MYRGEVWLVNLDPTVGTEISKKRPCVIKLISLTSQTAIPTERLRSTSQHPFFYVRVACRRYTTSRHRVFANCQKSDMIDW